MLGKKLQPPFSTMKPDSELNTLNRSNSYCNSTRKILPPSCLRSSSLSSTTQTLSITTETQLPNPKTLSLSGPNPNSKPRNVFIRSLLHLLSLPRTCRSWLTTSPSPTNSLARHKNRLTGTLFGHKKGHVTFAIQTDPRSDPVLLLELATSTSTLVKEMSSGLLRIALECKRSPQQHSSSSMIKLFQEPMWTMYCNGRKCGYAVSRTCGESDWHVLNTVQSVSVGAGVIPAQRDSQDDCKNDRTGNGGEGGVLMYMRAKFERVVGNRDSEAFYMLNPDGSGGPELSIFLLRI